MLYKSYLYSQWDGTQSVFDIDAEELMDRLSDDLMAHGDVLRALRDLFRRGIHNPMGQRMPGLQDLLEQLKDRRQQQLQQYDMDSVMEDLKRRLEEVLRTERLGIQRRLDEARQQVEEAEGLERAQKEELYQLLEQRAQRHIERLDSLPEGMGGAIRELMDYGFMDPEAQRQFQELLDMLKGRMADNISQGLKEQLQLLTPQNMAALRDMLRQLNRMVRERMMGLQPDFQGFMDQYGQMFGPDPPHSLEELMEQLQRQLAQVQSFLDSMSPQMRQELEDTLNSVLDPETQRAMAELAALMSQLMPIDDLARQYPFMGEESLTLDQAMELMGRLQNMDELKQTLQQAMRSGDLGQINPDQVAEILGEEARRTWEQL